MGVSECLPPLFKPGHACLEPISVNHDNAPKSNGLHLVATGNGLDEEVLESNDPIQLMNKFESLLSEDQHKPCEEGETQDEDLIASDKEESPHLGSPSPPKNLS